MVFWCVLETESCVLRFFWQTIQWINISYKIDNVALG